MKTKEVADMIKSIGLEYTYYQFKKGSAPSLPYILFYYPNNIEESADNIQFAKISALNIELYTKNKDFSNEAAVEAVLEQYGFSFAKTETFLDEENMYEVLYETSCVID